MGGFIGDIVNGAADAVGGGMGLLGSAPNAPGQVPLDQGSLDLINKQVANSSKGPGYFSGILNNGTDASRNLAQNPEQAGRETAGFGGGPGMQEAINRVYNQHASKQINQLIRQNDMQGYMMKADYMNQATGVLQRQNAAQLSQMQFLSQARMAEMQARSAFVGQLFQTANTAIAINASRKIQIQPSDESLLGPNTSQNFGAPDIGESASNTRGYGSMLGEDGYFSASGPAGRSYLGLGE